MNLLVVTEHLREPAFNGSEVVCRALVQALRRRHRVDVVARAATGTAASEVAFAVREEDRLDPARLRRFLAAEVDPSAYDLVYNLGALAFGCEVVDLLEPWNAGVPLVNHFQALLGPYARADGRPPDEQRRHATGQMTVAARAAINVFASQGEVRAALDFGYGLDGGEVAVIPNGISAAELDGVEPDEGFLPPARPAGGGRPLVIATAGRFSDYSKGADLVYRAFARLWRRRQDVFLLSIANKDRFAYLLADLPEHAWALVDWLPRRRFLSVLAACDLLVVPSRYEPFGLIALEAQALGVPVVANAVGGLAEIVHHGETGLLNPLADGSLGLSLAIERLAADPERLRRMRGPAREHARREYDFERVGALIERCLRRAELPGSLERSAGAVRSGAGEAAAAVFGGVN